MVSLKNEFIKLTPSERLYQCPFPIIGLTGGIASGKTTFANYFETLGITVINADLLIKKIYQDQSTIDYISSHFPNVVKNNQIDFKQLRELAFKDASTKQQLETYLYPKLPTAFNRELSVKPNTTLVLYDVPLLFEKKLQHLFDLILVISVNSLEQIRRVTARDQISSDLAKDIIANQLPLSEKLKLADVVIDNSDSSIPPERNADLQNFIKSYLTLQ